MTKLLRTFPDPERVVRDYLDGVLPESVGVGVPSDWVKGQSAPHVQVSLDGVFLASWPVAGEATIRLVAWAASPTAAKELAQRAHGYMLAHPGTPPIAGTRRLVGLIPSRDEQTGAETAAVTVRVTLRSIPIT